MQLMWSVDHQLHRVSKRMSVRLGLTAPQRLAIRVIGEGDGVRATELAETLRLHPSTVTGILKRLEASGLVERVTDEHDARSSTLHLTKKGAVVFRRSAGTVEAAVRQVLRRLPAADVAAAERTLADLAAALGAIGGLPASGRRRRGTSTR
jgi:MarR family transcriptional regulator, organic hydroperoxide resistance regulator